MPQQLFLNATVDIARKYQMMLIDDGKANSIAETD